MQPHQYDLRGPAAKENSLAHAEETVGNSMGRTPVGRSDTGVTRGWTEGKRWEIAWGELRWEGAIR